jgi:hypothetical protein
MLAKLTPELFLRKYLIFCLIFMVLAGIALRIWFLPGGGFFFYDEGLYLKHNLPVLEFISAHPQMGEADRQQAAYYYFRSALGSGKSLWFLLIDSRFLWGALADWSFSKVLSCFFGLITIPLVFLFTRRHFGSFLLALLASALFALLPGAVFYSRTGLQESLSIFLVLAGFYFYLQSIKLNWRVFIGGVFFALAFFANYRLIMLPFLVAFYELWRNYLSREGAGWRNYTWAMLVFFSGVVLGGNLLEGINTRVIAMWVFYQGQEAGGAFSWVNLFSYPFYVFRMESVLFAAAFFGNVFLLLRRQWEQSIFFGLILFQMFFFSFTEEKGARYLAVMLPFMAISAAFFLRHLWRAFPSRRIVLLAAALLMTVGMFWQSFLISSARSAHENAAEFLLARDPQAKWMASQEMVESLYVSPQDRVKAIPPSFERLLELYSQGYRYLVLDAQAYVSLAASRKFVPPLKDYLGFIDARVPPLLVIPHMNRALGERFVLEHSENLSDSLRFLSASDSEKAFSLRIYDLAMVVPEMLKIYQQSKLRRQ